MVEEATEEGCVGAWRGPVQRDAALRKAECDQLQGYYYSKPLSAEDCAAFIREQAQAADQAVQAFNTEIRTFPGVIWAKLVWGAKPMESFTASAGADRAPSVKF